MNIPNFDRVIGHARQLKLLRQLVGNDTVAGTYLFCGPEHVGKETVAVALAMALLCENPQSLGCGHCKSCREIASGLHPDLIILEPQGASQSIKMDQVEALRHRFHLSSFHGGWKVGIFRDAHALHYQSAPALLKMLEEPPARCVFMLVTHREDQVMPTLRSRAKIVPFFPLSEKEMRSALPADWSGDDAKTQSLLKLAGGRLGVALHITQGDFFSKRDKILELLEHHSFQHFSSALATVEGLSIPKTGGADAREEQRSQERETLFTLQTLLRDVWILRSVGESSAVLNADLVDRLSKLAQKWERVPLASMLERMEMAGRDLESNISMRLILERTLVGA